MLCSARLSHSLDATSGHSGKALFDLHPPSLDVSILQQRISLSTLAAERYFKLGNELSCLEYYPLRAGTAETGPCHFPLKWNLRKKPSSKQYQAANHLRFHSSACCPIHRNLSCMMAAPKENVASSFWLRSGFPLPPQKELGIKQSAALLPYHPKGNEKKFCLVGTVCPCLPTRFVS